MTIVTKPLTDEKKDLKPLVVVDTELGFLPVSLNFQPQNQCTLQLCENDLSVYTSICIFFSRVFVNRKAVKLKADHTLLYF